MVLNVSSKVTWLKANVAAQGFYLVRYGEDTWNALVRQLKQDKKVKINCQYQLKQTHNVK